MKEQEKEWDKIPQPIHLTGDYYQDDVTLKKMNDKRTVCQLTNGLPTSQKMDK